jgi:hypothetical protein
VTSSDDSREATRRSYGTGSLIARRDKVGLETWYGQWRVGTKLVKRRLGPKRRPGERTGLTKAQAERELRRLLDADLAVAAQARVDVAEAGERYLAHLRARGRERSTVTDYERSAAGAPRTRASRSIGRERAATPRSASSTRASWRRSCARSPTTTSGRSSARSTSSLP